MSTLNFIRCLLIGFVCVGFAAAQTTEFTYQGRLTDGAIAANASYDFEFRLYAAETSGTELGTQSRPGVSVISGIFTTRLDFGANFDGTPRWLEIAVKPAGGGSFTTLNPRQPISSVPYSIKSMNAAEADSATNASNAAQLGGVAADQYVVTTDGRMSDARSPLAGSPNYIQSNPLTLQAGTFNISGTGNANILNAATQFNIGSSRILSAPGTSNLFAGLSSGSLNSGTNNAFFGRNAGFINTSASFNSFFGSNAGSTNTTGGGNAFFGYQAGKSNTTGSDNAFFGVVAGEANTTGLRNSFFGGGAGFKNEAANNNSFFGNAAGYNNESGQNNAFFGYAAGFNNRFGNGNTFIGPGAGANIVTGNDNTFLGQNANASIDNLTNATAIGANASVGTSNTMVLGTDAVTVRVPGNLNISGSLTANLPSGDGSYIQNRNLQQGGSANFNISGNGTLGGTLKAHFVDADFLSSDGPINSDSQFTINDNAVLSKSSSTTIVLGRANDTVEIPNDLDVTNDLSAFRLNIGGTTNFNGRVNFFDNTFIQAPIGNGALLCRSNSTGFIVDCSASNVAEIAAMKEQIKIQQDQIASLREQIAGQHQIYQQIKQQQDQIEALKKLVCALSPAAELCQK